MFLKKLEINGFKSFANKIVFEFPSGVTAIVGPNGSGKSNIIDAIRWVLGERDSKKLRGEKAEDLIFAGTPSKPRNSSASVSLIFDNSNGDMPVDFKEVSITRKISRNGNSEYLINDSKVRLKDIISFFSKIRIGSKGLTIIGQGYADMFVASSNEDRMMMIKESLGLKEYELKKHDAELKLQNTKSHMEKVNAMMQEVLPRLRMLKRQTSKFKKREEIEKELSEIKMKYFGYQFQEIAKKKKEIELPLPELQKKLKELISELKTAKSELDEIDNEYKEDERLKDILNEKRELSRKKNDYEREILKLEVEEKINKNSDVSLNDIDKFKNTLEETAKDLENILTESSLDKIKSSIKVMINKINGLFNPVIKKENSRENNINTDNKIKLNQLINDIDKKLNNLEEKEEKISKKSEDFRDVFKGAFVKVEDKKTKINEIENKIKDIQFEKEKILYREEDLLKRLSSFDLNRVDVEEYIKSSGSISVNLSELDIIERRMMRLQGDISSIGDIDESLVEEADSVEEHYEFLKREYEDLSESLSNLRKLIKELQIILHEKFKESFSAVNNAFNTYFQTMFGGGSAKMKIVNNKKKKEDEENNVGNEEIVDNEDEKESVGVDIEVHVPGKRTANLDSLSGGERSLVSLAALFAIISIGIPPLLVLDEVDSALDEKNSARFSQLINKFAQETKFIIVTHNNITMENSGTFYGVTMEGGVSKIISLNFENAVAENS